MKKKGLISVVFAVFSLLTFGANSATEHMTIEDEINFSGTFRLSERCMQMRAKGFAKTKYRGNFLHGVSEAWQRSDPNDSVVKIYPWDNGKMYIEGAGYSFSIKTNSFINTESGSGNGILGGYINTKDTFDRQTMTLINDTVAAAVFPPQGVTSYQSLKLVDSEKMIIKGTFFDGWWFKIQECELQRTAKFSYIEIVQKLIDKKAELSDPAKRKSFELSVRDLRQDLQYYFRRASADSLKHEIIQAAELLDEAFGQDARSIIPRKASDLDY